MGNNKLIAFKQYLYTWWNTREWIFVRILPLWEVSQPTKLENDRKI